jgi:hypothetical protein
LTEYFSPGTRKAGALALLFKINQLDRQFKSPENKLLSTQIKFLASMIALVIDGEPGS